MGIKFMRNISALSQSFGSPKASVKAVLQYLLFRTLVLAGRSIFTDAVVGAPVLPLLALLIFLSVIFT